MEGGYAWWWEVVVQRRVTGLYLEGAKTSDEYFFFHVPIVSPQVSWLAGITQHTLPRPAWEILAADDLIGQKRYLHVHQAETLQPSFTQPTPLRSQTTQHSSLAVPYTPSYLSAQPRRP